ncbi:LOG family protein [Chlamydiifrater phoenicopteri]|uniref:LOG family protein n=1 Tax=Chlamydiifrater phoenicopteri TaxID=2681469 RepID=UPI001BCD7F0D|nr:LOG family protein [Chlamydiifrater phoenicopteri]
MLEKEDEVSMGGAFLSNSDPLIAFFGGDKVSPKSKEYLFAQKLAERLSNDCFNIVTGGGNGIMEAANSGALSGSGLSYVLHFEEFPFNPYFSPGCIFSFKDLSAQKRVILENSAAYIFFPGGFGTFNELSEVISLFSVGQLLVRPAILVGSNFWYPLLEWIKTQIFQNKYAEIDVFSKLLVLDSEEEIVHTIKSFLDNL